MQNLINSGVIFGILTMFCWGVGDVLWAYVSRKIGNVVSLMMAFLANLTILLILLFTWDYPQIFDLKSTIFSSIAGVLYLLAAIFYFQGFIKGSASLVAAIGSPWAIIVIAFGVVFLDEKLNLLQGISLGIIIIGTIVTSIDLSELKDSTKAKFSDPGIKYGFAALICWGIGFLFVNESIRTIGVLIPNIILAVVGSIILSSTLLFSKKHKRKLNLANYKILILGFIVGIFGIGGFIFYGMGVEGNNASMVSAIATASPVVTTFLSHIFFKDKLSLPQYFGAGLIFAGVIALSI